MSLSFAPRLIIVGALLALSPICMDAAGAEPVQNTELKSVRFSFQFDRTDLASEEGASRIRKALTSRARKACTDWSEPSVSLTRTDASCVAQLVEKTSDQIRAERLAGHRGMTVTLTMVPSMSFARNSNSTF